MAALWILTMLSCGSCCPSSRYIRKPLSRSDCLCKRHSGTALGNSEPILPGSSRISPPLHHNLCPRYVVESIQRIVLSFTRGGVCATRLFAKIRNKEGEENRFRRASATSRLRTLRRRAVWQCTAQKRHLKCQNSYPPLDYNNHTTACTFHTQPPLTFSRFSASHRLRLGSHHMRDKEPPGKWRTSNRDETIRFLFGT